MKEAMVAVLKEADTVVSTIDMINQPFYRRNCKGRVHLVDEVGMTGEVITVMLMVTSSTK